VLQKYILSAMVSLDSNRICRTFIEKTHRMTPGYWIYKSILMHNSRIDGKTEHKVDEEEVVE